MFNFSIMKKVSSIIFTCLLFGSLNLIAAKSKLKRHVERNIANQESSILDLVQSTKGYVYLCRSSSSNLRYALNIKNNTLEIYEKNETTPFKKVASYNDIKLVKSKRKSSDLMFTNKKAGMMKHEVVSFFIEEQSSGKGRYEAHYQNDENIICKKNI